MTVRTLVDGPVTTVVLDRPDACNAVTDDGEGRRGRSAGGPAQPWAGASARQTATSCAAPWRV